MKKISVKVCLGTSCFVKGSANFQKLKDIIPEKYGDKVEISSCLCLGICSIKWQQEKTPYVKIDDDIIEEATVEKVINALDKKLNTVKSN